jgi:hypothetical protein
MNFIPVRTYSNYIEAHIALSMLQDEGINCHLQDEHAITMINFSSGMKLMVYESQLERSLEILQKAEIKYLETISCPACGQNNLTIKFVTEDSSVALKKIPFGTIISAMANFFSREGTKLQVKHYVCTNCHAEYDTLPSPA